jgi:hypothetical protein
MPCTCEEKGQKKRREQEREKYLCGSGNFSHVSLITCLYTAACREEKIPTNNKWGLPAGIGFGGFCVVLE